MPFITYRKSHHAHFILLLSLLALLTLTACRTDASIAIQPHGSIKGSADLSVDAALAGTAGFSCSDLEKIGTANNGALTSDSMQLHIDDQSTDQTLHCVVTLDTVESKVGSSVLSETETSYIFSFPRGILNDANIRTINMLSPQFALSIAMPGAIISAPGASINGNTATFTDIDVLVDGFNVEGEKALAQESNQGSGVDGETTVTPAVTDDTQQASFSFLEWTLIGIGVLLVLILGIGIVRHRRSRRQGDDPHDKPDTLDSFLE